MTSTTRSSSRSLGTSLAAAGLSLAVLAACAAKTENDSSLALACQTRPCICTPDKLTLFNRDDSVPIQWKLNGDAYCPEGHVLKLSTDE